MAEWIEAKPAGNVP